ncbi:Sbal_3080 family lipoprotein [Vitreoscilla massiliensis]|uniref:Sbal_3080 family lipoprotein n=1 Tax=Vitreoscilla massiliensis TaxID=1689272 RepID=A0ABY4DZJ8_9NEIS|nr:Sbal_3080 family lipoprotein [Vitreoscilla massiliensis]UOO88945.1 Sbal_3080 family lipoprotein [Vitreoscilla massiliensis]
MKRSVALAISLTAVSACTSVQVNAVAENKANAIEQVCIIKNPAVLVVDFVPVLQKRLQHHGIASRVMAEEEAGACQYKLHYSAKRSWDFTPYMSWAELKLFQDHELVANAEYKLVGKGGLSLTKWQSVETKMTPVIDQLFIKRNKRESKETPGFETEILPINSSKNS